MNKGGRGFCSSSDKPDLANKTLGRKLVVWGSFVQSPSNPTVTLIVNGVESHSSKSPHQQRLNQILLIIILNITQCYSKPNPRSAVGVMPYNIRGKRICLGTRETPNETGAACV